MHQLLTQFAAPLISPSEIGYQPVTDPNTGIQGVLNVVYIWAGIVAVLVIVIAGYYYVTSQGDAAKTQQAKNAIIAAVIGIACILSAFLITQYVIGRF